MDALPDSNALPDAKTYTIIDSRHPRFAFLEYLSEPKLP